MERASMNEKFLLMNKALQLVGGVALSRNINARGRGIEHRRLVNRVQYVFQET